MVFDGIDLVHLCADEMRKFRRRMQMIFQDPYASMNPRMTVGEIVSDPLLVYQEAKTRKEIEDRVADLLAIGETEPGLHQPLPARIFRRSAPADWDRAGSGAAARIDRVR